MTFLIRNVQLDDIQDFKGLSEELNTVNLPSQSVDLKKIINRSVKSFQGKYQGNKSRAQFLFVLEDTESGRVLGTSKIFARHGTPQRPHVYFKVMEEEVTSKSLSIRFRRKFFRLKKDIRGYTEIGGLVLDPQFRGHPEKLGKQLSLIRFLFMKAHPSWFKRRVIAELLPPLHEGYPSTLYRFYGFRLTRLPYRKADLISFKNKEFILKLFPKSDLYYDILPEEVQADIEKTGPGSEAARRILTEIGFHYAKQIDPFDGGPYFVAKLPEINVYRETQSYIFGGEMFKKSGERFLLMMEHRGQVRGMVSRGIVLKNRLYLPKETESLLSLREGHRVYTFPWD